MASTFLSLLVLCRSSNEAHRKTSKGRFSSLSKSWTSRYILGQRWPMVCTHAPLPHVMPIPSFEYLDPCALVIISSLLGFFFFFLRSLSINILCAVDTFWFLELCNSDSIIMEYGKEWAYCVYGIITQSWAPIFFFFLVFYNHFRPEAMLCTIL